MEKQENELIGILRKKAAGYTVNEQVTEYDGEGNEVKQKVTVKDVPPDLSAIKMLLEMTDEEILSEEDLEKERENIMAQLKELYNMS